MDLLYWKQWWAEDASESRFWFCSGNSPATVKLFTHYFQDNRERLEFEVEGEFTKYWHRLQVRQVSPMTHTKHRACWNRLFAQKVHGHCWHLCRAVHKASSSNRCETVIIKQCPRSQCIRRKQENETYIRRSCLTLASIIKGSNLRNTSLPLITVEEENKP